MAASLGNSKHKGSKMGDKMIFRKRLIKKIFVMAFIIAMLGLFIWLYSINELKIEGIAKNILKENVIEKVYEKSFIQYNDTGLKCTEGKKIILRMDDARAYSIPTPYLVDEVINRNLSITLGLIPSKLENDVRMQKYLLKISRNPNIEIAQHGNYHDARDENINEENLLAGNKKIQELIRVIPVTYIPPYNKIGKDSIIAVSKYFKIISSKPGILKKENGVLIMGGDAETYDYSNHKYVPINTVISDCKHSLENKGICVIIIHPQEYSTDINNPKDISEEKMNEFKNMLDGLQELNATFTTFSKASKCI